MERLGLDNVQGKDVRSVLITDRQAVTESLRNDQSRVHSLALQQCVGRDRCAHFDGMNWCRAAPARGPAAYCLTYSLGSRIVILLGVLRQQFGSLEFPVRPQSDDIGKSPAAVDPELPVLFAVHSQKGNGNWGRTALFCCAAPQMHCLHGRKVRFDPDFTGIMCAASPGRAITTNAILRRTET